MFSSCIHDLLTVSGGLSTQAASNDSGTQLTIGRYIIESKVLFSAAKKEVMTSCYVCGVTIVDHIEVTSVRQRLQVTLLVEARHESGYSVLTHL